MRRTAKSFNAALLAHVAKDIRALNRVRANHGWLFIGGLQSSGSDVSFWRLGHSRASPKREMAWRLKPPRTLQGENPLAVHKGESPRIGPRGLHALTPSPAREL